MADSQASKLFQKRVYDILSHRYGLIIVICSCILLAASAFQFGEALLEWSEEKYATVFNSFSDNIAGRSYRKRLCLPVPIDVVYTWVNGSDPGLLYELRQYKEVVEVEINQTAKSEKDGCHFANCLPSKLVIIDPPFPSALPKETLGILYPSLKNVIRMFAIKNPADQNATVTVLEFSTFEQVEEALKEDVKVAGSNATVKQAYYTTDWTIPNSLLLPDKAMLMGFPHTMTDEKLKGHLPKQYQPNVDKIEIYSDKGIAVVSISNKEELEKFLAEENFTVEGKVQSIQAANLLWDLRDYSAGEQIGANRFQDNEELRYSMRSLEQHAPWIRQVFLVTNGQIPSWLNLDNPRLTLVTHDEIFKNKSHLPSFSSPAIESHLHEIPGLSDKFIYLNDDVMFGKDVWPDDFYTHTTGQKVYLTWPVPNCQDGCPQSWIKDGYCDKACNNSECEWDGGDCAGGASAQLGWGQQWGQENDALYCSGGCANNWLADRYCDQSCNVLQCGFDAGDCGVDNFAQLTQLNLNRSNSHYKLSPGHLMAYFNLSAFLGVSGKIEDGSYDESPVIRSVAIAQKFKVISIILYKGHNTTTLNFSITAKFNEQDAALHFNFSLTVNTNITKVVVNKTEEEKKTEEKEEKGEEKEEKSNEIPPEDLSEFEEIPKMLLGPKTVSLGVVGSVKQVNLSHYVLPDDIEERLGALRRHLQEGDLTEKGFNKKQSALWDEYYERLRADGKEPQKATQKPAQIEPNLAHYVGAEEQKGFKGEKFVGDQEQLQLQVDQNIKQAQNGQQQVESFIHDGQPQAQENQAFVQNGQRAVEADQAFVRRGQQEDNNQGFVQQQAQASQVFGQNGQQQIQANQAFVQNGQQQADMNQAFFQHGQQQAAPDQADVHNGQEFVKQPLVQQPDNSQGDQRRNLQPDQPLMQARNDGEQPGGAAVEGQDVDRGDAKYGIDEAHKSRKLNGLGDNVGFLPWEKVGVFDNLLKKKEELMAQQEYITSGHKTRRLLDKYSDSLRHVNKLYNSAYGYSARKVPAHMPHMVDKNIMAELQTKFEKAWEETSSHKIRHSQDMQFSFSYFYYLMSEPNQFSASDVFVAMDTDSSGILSDREIRTLATRVYELPLDLQKLTSLESMFTNCSKHMPADPLLESLQPEQYYEKTMPQVTSKLFSNCKPVVELVQKNFHAGSKYKYEIVGDEEVSFKMIKTNVSSVVGQLDDIRRNPKKFICLNDDIDHSREEAKTTKAVLQDFYESLFPVPSSFELPREYRNRFLHIQELREWRKYRDWLKLWTQVALFLLILFTLSSFFSDKIESLQRRFMGRRAGSRATAEPSAMQTV